METTIYYLGFEVLGFRVIMIVLGLAGSHVHVFLSPVRVLSSANRLRGRRPPVSQKLCQGIQCMVTS